MSQHDFNIFFTINKCKISRLAENEENGTTFYIKNGTTFYIKKLFSMRFNTVCHPECLEDEYFLGGLFFIH